MKNDSDDSTTAEKASSSDGASDIGKEGGMHLEGDVSPGDAEAQVEGGARETTEPRIFTVVRKADESGVSGTGRVLDGCIFHNGQVVICWRGDINSEKSGYSSLAIYPCWEAFYKVHIGAHPTNETEVIFGRGAGLMARLIDQAAEEDSSDATSLQVPDQMKEAGA